MVNRTSIEKNGTVNTILDAYFEFGFTDTHKYIV